MTGPKWITERMALAIHEEAIAQFGGKDGVRDAGLLDSALSRPQRLKEYGSAPTLFDLAAGLCVGIAKNHPFVDGNKRTALLCARAFLYLNGWVLEPEEKEEVETMVGVATGELTEPRLAKWFEDNAKARRPRRK
jgi:death-on-curing protein